MFGKFEAILTAISLALSALFLFLIILRIRNVFFRYKPRISIRSGEVGIIYKISRLLMAIALILMGAGILYFIFIVLLPASVIRVYAKTLFIISFSSWILLEVYLCRTISRILLSGHLFRRILYFTALAVSASGAVYFFPMILRSLPFPQEAECVILELPVRGKWLAGHAGATELTNPHTTNLYAIDFLKLGKDSRFYSGNEDTVTDFYSFNEFIYAPADGVITQVTDTLESDLLGHRDKEHPGGNFVILDIGNERYVYLAHLRSNSIGVQAGQKVKAGDVIGRAGNSGNSTVPHLHMHVQNKPVSNSEGRITYPFRFLNLHRKRLLFWREVHNAALIRNDLVKTL
ncbi:MAG: M23 family metallopeptidase [Bacteroidales bacterium]|nr:M23 family metallopeptidase [Bacteroidales bacterium]